MRNSFQNHIRHHFPFLLTNKCIVAVSAGIDSMVLLALCQQLDCTIAVAHCNFGLRGHESDADENFVREYCQAHKIPFYVNRFNTEQFAKESGRSIQMTARQLRYDWFETLRIREGYDFIVTAHQADDVVETFMINLTRGTGCDGLTGIPEQNGAVIRPLLPFSRTEIEQFAADNLISWREDASNATTHYQRNALRHKVIPVLKTMNPAFLENFQKTVKYIQDTQQLTNWAVKQFLEKALQQKGDEFHLDLAQLNTMPSPRAILFYWLKNYGFTAWEDINQLPNAVSGKQLFSPDYVLLKNRAQLILYPRNMCQQEAYFIEKTRHEITFPIQLVFCNKSDITTVDVNTIFVDADLLVYPLVLRKWENGDVFHPIGLKGSKKISKFFKDEKYSLTDKKRQWLLCSDNKIVWVIGKRADDRFKITNNTKTKLKITFSE